MPSYLVVFDEGSDALKTELASISQALVPLKNKNVWVVNGDWTADQLAKRLAGFELPPGDRLIVLTLSGGFGEIGLAENTIDWLHDNLIVR